MIPTSLNYELMSIGSSQRLSSHITSSQLVLWCHHDCRLCPTGVGQRKLTPALSVLGGSHFCNGPRNNSALGGFWFAGKLSKDQIVCLEREVFMGLIGGEQSWALGLSVALPTGALLLILYNSGGHLSRRSPRGLSHQDRCQQTALKCLENVKGLLQRGLLSVCSHPRFCEKWTLMNTSYIHSVSQQMFVDTYYVLGTAPGT